MSAGNHNNSNVYRIFPKNAKSENNKTSQKENLNKYKEQVELTKKIKSSHEAKSGHGIKSGHVIKAGDLDSSSIQVSPYVPSGISDRRAQRPGPGVIPPADETTLALQSLRRNFQALNDIQARFRFMLQELEELIKD